MSSGDENKKEEEATTAIAVSEIVVPVAPIADIKKAWKEFQKLKDEMLDESDWQPISVRVTDPKTGVERYERKKFIKRSGFRKIALAFGLSDEILEEKRTDRPDGSFMWKIRARVWAKNERSAEGVGVCDSKEKAFLKDPLGKKEHKVYATAHTRAKSRAISDLVAGGVVSAEEMLGEGESRRENWKTDEELRSEGATPPGPPRGGWPPSDEREPTTAEQRQKIGQLCRKIQQDRGWNVLNYVLEYNKVAQLEQLTYEQADKAIAWLEGQLGQPG